MKDKTDEIINNLENVKSCLKALSEKTISESISTKDYDFWVGNSYEQQSKAIEMLKKYLKGGKDEKATTK